jgi:hypothetical protein
MSQVGRMRVRKTMKAVRHREVSVLCGTIIKISIILLLAGIDIFFQTLQEKDEKILY